MIQPRNVALQALRIAGVFAAIALVTVAGRRVPVNATTAGLVYLLAVLLFATFGTLAEAVVASVAAAICLNYFFLPPLFRFTIASPQDWVALFVFLATAAIVSKLSSVAKAQTEAAVNRSREMERLYSLSRAVLLNTSPESTARDVAIQIARVFNLASVSLFERSTEQIHRAGVLDLPDWDDRLRLAALNGTLFEDHETRTVATSVRLGADVIGSLVLRGEPLSDSALQSLANLVAVALERARLLESTNAAELIRKSEELKSTLLDAIAHEFKTPLTSIKAAASALRSGVDDPSTRQEFIEILDEEADRLERLVTGAIQMARIEAGELRLERRISPISEIIAKTVASLAGVSDGRTVTQIADANLMADADPELLHLALKQVLDNAFKYSTPGSPIAITAQEQEGDVLVTVANHGRGIPESEQRHIFERYYRAPGTRDRVPGTGIGLAIARDITLAHGGRIWAESTPGEGSRIQLLIPSRQEGTPA